MIKTNIRTYAKLVLGTWGLGHALGPGAWAGVGLAWHGGWPGLVTGMVTGSLAWLPLRPKSPESTDLRYLVIFRNAWPGHWHGEAWLDSHTKTSLRYFAILRVRIQA